MAVPVRCNWSTNVALGSVRAPAVMGMGGAHTKQENWAIIFNYGYSNQLDNTSIGKYRSIYLIVYQYE